MSIHNFFIISISSLLLIISIVTSIFVALETKTSVTAHVNEQKNNLRNEIHRLLSVTDTLMEQRVNSSLKLLIERGEQLGTAKIEHEFEIANIASKAPGLILAKLKSSAIPI